VRNTAIKRRFGTFRVNLGGRGLNRIWGFFYEGGLGGRNCQRGRVKGGMEIAEFGEACKVGLLEGISYGIRAC